MPYDNDSLKGEDIYAHVSGIYYTKGYLSYKNCGLKNNELYYPRNVIKVSRTRLQYLILLSKRRIT
mgnify:CR=1 FL=1